MTYPLHAGAMLSLKESDMARRRGQRTGWLRSDHGSWLLTYRLYDQWGGSRRETVTIGPAEGRGKLTEKQAERAAWSNYLSKADQIATKPKSTMSLEQFWKEKYWPQAELRLKKSTRGQYSSHWAKWIQPRLGHFSLAMISPDHVEMLLADVRAAGRSTETIRHVRKVLSAILRRARRLQYISGDNPAGLVELPDAAPVRKAYALTQDQALAILKTPMPERYRGMIWAALLTGMNAAELCGIKWGYVNLDGSPLRYEGETIQPLHVAVRWQWYRGEYGTLKTGERKRDIPLSGPMVDLLKTMRRRGRWTKPEDPVFAARNGKPLDEHNIQRRHLSPIGKKMGLSHLGWHTFRHTFETWLERSGAAVADRQALLGHGSVEMMDRYTHEDRARMIASVEGVAGQLVAGGDGRVN